MKEEEEEEIDSEDETITVGGVAGKRRLKKKGRLMVRCYKAGMTKAMLARAFGVTLPAILYHLRKFKVHEDSDYTKKKRKFDVQSTLSNLTSDNIIGE